MATRPDYFPYEAGLRDLLTTYRRAQRDIVKQIRDALANQDLTGASQRQAQLRAVLETLDRLGVQTDPVAQRMVADAFTQSATKVAGQIAGMAVSPPEIPGAFSSVSQDAVQALQDSITGRLRASRQQLGRSVDDLYARAGRRAAMHALLGSSGSPRTARKRMMQDLFKDPQIKRTVMRGGAGFIDSAGRRWQLVDYCDMAVRTVTREAVVQGAITRMTSHGINLARVTRHNNPCEVCRPWEGRLVSLDGQTAEYEGEAVASLSSLPGSGPPFHPRCRHTISPVASRIDAIRRELQAQGVV